ncbi:MAG TPA: HAD family hydrolase [Clostridia bacterium]|nr:HAD family hydrolase [Clostridia bacterium]
MILYISDLDGTLLNSEGKLSDYTVEKINEMIDKGLDFTIATARGFDSVKSILEPLNLKYPVILNNGLFIYDLKKSEVIKEYSIDISVANNLLEDLSSYGIYPMVSTKAKEVYKVYYSGIQNHGEKEFIKFHGQSSALKFIEVESVDLKNEKVLSMFSIGTKEELQEVTDYLSHKYNLEINLFYDIYSKYYWLEINPLNASKGDAALYLKEEYGFKQLITFGDNLNDVSMFKISDESYAMASGNSVVKPEATAVIGTNDEHSVAKYIRNRRMKKYKHKEVIS